jgi:sporulation protein YlmC with PRC-barrel domain
VTLGQILNRKVVTESGLGLGRVHDVCGEVVGGQLRLTGFVTGSRGMLERLGVGTGPSGVTPKTHTHPMIPWDRVLRVGPEIVVRD